MIESAETRFRALMADAPVMVWLSGLSSECEFFNQRWLDFTGRTMEQERGVGWAEGVHHEDLQACMTAYLEAFAARRAFHVEYRLRRHDGEFRWVRDTGHPRTEGGTFRGFVGSCIDVTEIHEAQELQRLLDEDLERFALREMVIIDPLVVVGAPATHALAPPPPARASEQPRLPRQREDWMLNSLRELQQAQESLRASQARYLALSRRLLQRQEDERAWLARELHDQLGQSLSYVAMTLGSIDGDSPSGFRPHVRQCLRVLEQMLEQVRTLAFDLRPSTLDDLGMVEALRRLVVRHEEWTGVTASFTASPEEVRAPPEVEIAGFRIAQEALTNVARHARAGRVDVSLVLRNEGLELAVRDDGVGFDVDQQLRSGLGLVGMNERAALAGGRLEIESTRESGTTLRACFPVPCAAAGVHPIGPGVLRAGRRALRASGRAHL